jgi:hypothetical protein
MMKCGICGQKLYFAPDSTSDNGLLGKWNCHNKECAMSSFHSTQQGTFEKTAQQVGKLVDEKNAAYGDSFAKCGEFLKLLYPNGIQPHQYTDALCLVRIFDKQMRIATRKDAFGESPYRDIAGYGLLGLVIDERIGDNAATSKEAVQQTGMP